jgi:hypothetical protein
MGASLGPAPSDVLPDDLDLRLAGAWRGRGWGNFNDTEF